MTIKNDYEPKYCKTCKQRHNDKECFIVHQELYPKKEIEGNEIKEKQNMQRTTGKQSYY